MFFSLIKLLINVNLTLRRRNVSSVVSSSPQREPENTSNKLESGTGSQHNTNGYVQFDSLLKSAGLVFDGSKRTKNVILNWFQLWEKPHAWVNQPRPQLIKPAIKFGFKHLRRQKTHTVLTPNTWSETCITQRPGQTPEGIVLKRIDWGNFLHPFSAKRHNWTSDERLLEGLFDEENVEFGHLDTIKTHREARVRRDQSRKMSCRQHNRTFNITKIQLQRWRETGILWIF